MNDEIIKEFESFLSSISSEDLEDIVKKYDSEFENGNFHFECATDYMFENSSDDVDDVVLSIERFNLPISCECTFVEAA
ncbi:hypothetical protein [Fibrobacter sp.]|uniref:hypothetical protein n=1 Tax=Fibrobacter sp. TaxID=35828 RepID=UPI00388CF4C2